MYNGRLFGLIGSLNMYRVIKLSGNDSIALLEERNY